MSGWLLLVAWLVDPFGWATGPGDELRALGGANGFAETTVARAAEGTFRVKVRPEKRGEPSVYSSLGLILRDDDCNFWRLALCQAPAPREFHFFELEEMRQWQWMCAGSDGLRLEKHEVAGQWKWGEEYELALDFCAAYIEGTVRDAAGKLLFRRRYVYGDRPHIGQGGAAVMSCGTAFGTFRAFRADIRRPATENAAIVPYGGVAYAPGVTGARTGFFHVERKNGRWWAIDPLGRATLYQGIEHATYQGMGCEARNGRRAYQETNDRKYGSVDAWSAATVGRLRQWGFNALGSTCAHGLRYRGLAHTEFLGLGDTLCMIAGRPDLAIHPNPNKTPGSAMPNVFHPQFPAWCDYVAKRKCAPCRDDPWLFGYYLDNELRWSGNGDRGSATGIFDAVAALPKTHTARQALDAFVRERTGRTPSSADDLAATAADVKREFLRLVARKYFTETAAAIRRYDPNHLILGCRFAGIDNADGVVWEEAGRSCDIVSFNLYPHVDLAHGVVLDRFTRTRRAADDLALRAAQAKKPLLVTEWSFPALDSGLPCTCGAGQRFRTQDERAAAAATFLRLLRETPSVIGHCYFMWVDDPPLGIRHVFGEDSNYGLVSERDEPYEKLTSVFARFQDLTQPPPRVPPTPAPAPRTADPRTRLAGPSGGVFFARATDRIRDDIYIVSNRVGLVLRGRIDGGNLFGDVSVGGVPVGRLTLRVAVNSRRGQRWQTISRVRPVDFRVADDDTGRLRIRAEGAAEDQKFTLTAVCTVGPDRREILCDLETLTNAGEVPLEVNAFYFCNYVHGAAVRMQKARGVPFLADGLAYDAFRRKDGETWMGTLSWAPSIRYFLFYVDSRGGQGANAQFNLPGATRLDAEHDQVRLQPAETYEAKGRVWAMALPGTNGDDGWAALVNAEASARVRP